jgi:hypothetical protein
MRQHRCLNRCSAYNVGKITEFQGGQSTKVGGRRRSKLYWSIVPSAILWADMKKQLGVRMVVALVGDISAFGQPYDIIKR